VAAGDRGICWDVSGDVRANSGMGLWDGHLSDSIRASNRHGSQT